MQFKQLVIYALGLGQAIAAPSAEAAGKTIVAKYDDLRADPLLPFTELRNPYKGLRYDNWGVLGRGLEITPGSLKPYTSPNTAFFSTLTQLTRGIATIKVEKGSFDLESMRFGCSTILGITRIPFDCEMICSTVTKTGLRKSTTLKFSKDDEMELFNFPPNQFKDLVQVSFVLSGQPVPDTTFAAQFDNLTYKLKK